MIIRSAVPIDLDAVQALRNDLDARRFSRGGPSAKTRDWAERLFESGGLYVGVEVDGTIVGYVHVNQDKNAPMISVAVASDARHNGFGSQLVRVAMAREAGTFSFYEAWVHKDNTASLLLFSRLGFESRGMNGDFVGMVWHRR